MTWIIVSLYLDGDGSSGDGGGGGAATNVTKHKYENKKDTYACHTQHTMGQTDGSIYDYMQTHILRVCARPSSTKTIIISVCIRAMKYLFGIILIKFNV